MIDRASFSHSCPRAIATVAAARGRFIALGFAGLALLAAGLGRPSFARAADEPTNAATANDSLGTDSAESDSFVVVPPGWAEGRNLTPIAGDDPGAGIWLRAPFGENLLTHPDAWSASGRPSRLAPLLDYNRVDQLRLGVRYEAQAPDTHFPRFGARYEYALGRERGLYGVQIEQPLIDAGRLALGVTLVRVTDHSELHQVDDLENTLAMLLGRQDYRDYFEREGFGAYLSSRIAGFSTVSVTAGNHQYRSLTTIGGTRSWLHRDRSLRANPPIAEGEAHTLSLRLERLAHRTRATRAGLYHWIELERAGAGLGGDFDYTRLLADLRSVLRLSPATTLALRLVGGSALAGSLTPQREFTAGGVDGLRAHAFSEFRGNQLFLAQGEYTIGLWRLRTSGFEGGLHAIAFLDAGRAWRNDGDAWDPGTQRMAADGGFGLGTSEDNFRVYFAKNLHDADSKIKISARLQRPF